MRARHGFGVALAMTLLLPMPGSHAGELDAAGVAAAIDRWLAGTRDMECRFEQRLVSGALGASGQESGTLKIVRPGRMRWDYTKPEAKIAILEGDRTIVYLPADRQMVRGRLEGSSGLLHALLGGRSHVEDLFDSSLAATPARGGDGAYRLRLVPRDAEGRIEAVTLAARPPAFAIESAEVLDAAGNVIEYRFSGIRRNRGVPASAFRFEPPPGTEIIDSE